MGFIFGLIRRLFRWSIYLVIFIAAIVLINLPPYAKFTTITLDPAQSFEGPLALNGALNNAQKLYLDKVSGPEAFQLFEGEVYTSLATGEIVKLSPGGHVTFVTKIGQPCTGLLEEEKCGRPLDFKIDEKERKLIVADAYYGIWKVDLKTDKKQLLVSPNVPIEGTKPKFFNGIALANNGDFYWTDSCSEFNLKDGSYCILIDPSGRLFHYNAAKNESKVLLDNLWMPNGVAISPDNQFVIVAESGRMRLLKYYIAGPKKGKSEIFVTGLPGTPDNVRALPDGSGALVALYAAEGPDAPLLARPLAAAPAARKFLARLLRLIEIPFEFLHAQFPHVIFDTVIYNIGSFKLFSNFLPPLAGLVQVDWNGNVVASYYNTDDSLGTISDAIVFGDKLLTGSPHSQHFIGSVPAPALLKKAFACARGKSAEQKTEPPKPKVETKQKQETVKEVPKQAKKEESKPVVKETPKVEKPKVKEPVKAPVKETVKPKEPPKVTTTPKPAPKPESKAKVDSKPVEKKASAADKKAEKPTTPPPKPAEKKPAEKPSAKKVEPEAKTKAPEQKTEKVQKKDLPEQIPIEETIPSDTAKPAKKPLRVIKKEGPAEIPNNL